MTATHPGIGYARAALAGDDAAIDALAKAWLPTVYAWCHRLGGPGVDAEGAAHDVLMVMCRKVQSVRTPEQFPSWLFGACRRVVANHRRKAWLRRWVPGPIGDRPHPDRGPERSAQARQAADIVWKALDALPAGQREVLVLCELEERSGSEAAEILGVPLGTVKSRLRVAKQAFRAAVEAQGVPADGTPAVEGF
ncbi:MAG: sigma-70 family RNA polymerase sigma factor [Alphaproteobacteria bacterium]|nr:sigma-70 family RNA polymerase sigma factor [Alphaproteobacteria bacterium]